MTIKCLWIEKPSSSRSSFYLLSFYCVGCLYLWCCLLLTVQLSSVSTVNDTKHHWLCRIIPKLSMGLPSHRSDTFIFDLRFIE